MDVHSGWARFRAIREMQIAEVFIDSVLSSLHLLGCGPRRRGFEPRHLIAVEEHSIARERIPIG